MLVALICALPPFTCASWLHAGNKAASTYSQQFTRKRITLIIAWWGPGINAEPGVKGQGPCRVAPCPSAAPDTPGQDPCQIASNSKAELDASDSGLRRAAPLNTAAPTYCSKEGAGSDSAQDTIPESNLHASSEPATQSHSQPATDSLSQVHSRQGEASSLDPEIGASSVPSCVSQPQWLDQCRLTQQQQQHYKQHRQTPGALGIPHQDPSVNEYPIQGINSVTSQSCNTGRRLEAFSGQHGQSEFMPPTVSPVWVPVGQSAWQSSNAKQEDLQQHATKRPRLRHDAGDDSHMLQEQQLHFLPIPPLRFFIRSPHEFASIYLPSKSDGD